MNRRQALVTGGNRTMPGLFQINARMSKNVQPGDKVPVHVKIGDLTSQEGVTLAVR